MKGSEPPEEVETAAVPELGAVPEFEVPSLPPPWVGEQYWA